MWEIIADIIAELAKALLPLLLEKANEPNTMAVAADDARLDAGVGGDIRMQIDAGRVPPAEFGRDAQP
jgi:hypothetical protein